MKERCANEGWEGEGGGVDECSMRERSTTYHRPPMTRKRLLLPTPEGPMTITLSPRGISTEKLRNSSLPPVVVATRHQPDRSITGNR